MKKALINLYKCPFTNQPKKLITTSVNLYITAYTLRDISHNSLMYLIKQ